jgi:hypothetical protein
MEVNMPDKELVYVYVAVVDGVDDDPSWHVLGVTESLESAQQMALNYFDAFDDAHISTDDPHVVEANGGMLTAQLYQRYMGRPDNGF